MAAFAANFRGKQFREQRRCPLLLNASCTNVCMRGLHAAGARARERRAVARSTSRSRRTSGRTCFCDVGAGPRARAAGAASWRAREV